MHGDSRREDTVRPTNFVCDQDGMVNGGNGKEGLRSKPDFGQIDQRY